jgi:hypothetical protein
MGFLIRRHQERGPHERERDGALALADHSSRSETSMPRRLHLPQLCCTAEGTTTIFRLQNLPELLFRL